MPGDGVSAAASWHSRSRCVCLRVATRIASLVQEGQGFALRLPGGLGGKLKAVAHGGEHAARPRLPCVIVDDLGKVANAANRVWLRKKALRRRSAPGAEPVDMLAYRTSS